MFSVVFFAADYEKVVSFSSLDATFPRLLTIISQKAQWEI